MGNLPGRSFASNSNTCTDTSNINPSPSLGPMCTCKVHCPWAHSHDSTVHVHAHIHVYVHVWAMYIYIYRTAFPTLGCAIVVCMSRKHKGVQLTGMANKNKVLQRSWALPNNLKHNGAGFLTINFRWIHYASESLRCLHGSQDLAIFVLINRSTDKWTDSEPWLLYPCCACARGVHTCTCIL